MHHNAPIFPPSTLGILGGGQLGRYFARSAQQLGYQVIVLDPNAYSPASTFANEHICSDYLNPKALEKLAQKCQAISTEFENVPVQALQYLQQHTTVFPSAENIAIAQDRILEKELFCHLGLETTEFIVLRTVSDCHQVPPTHFPAILKTARLGYDGKNQKTVSTLEALIEGFCHFKQTPCILEKKLSLDQEISVILARNAIDKQCTFFPVIENQHHQGILNLSIAPARICDTMAQQACSIAKKIADHLDYTGVLAVEFFISQQKLLVNEIAPRPHNSGHFSLDGCLASQFDQQVRMLCSLKPAITTLSTPTVMLNLLGHYWDSSQHAQAWQKMLNDPYAKLHLYGKRNLRPNRKMGHICFVGKPLAQLIEMAQAYHQDLINH